MKSKMYMADYSCTDKIKTVTQFPIIDFFTPHKYKRILRVHLAYHALHIKK